MLKRRSEKERRGLWHCSAEGVGLVGGAAASPTDRVDAIADFADQFALR
jgi:hypothetical protein